MASNQGQSSCVAYLWISFLLVGVMPGVVSNVRLTSIPSTVQPICPGEAIEFICIIESSILLWTSDEYIGVGSPFEFRIIDSIGISRSSPINPDTIANLTEINGGILTSTLHVVASQSSTIACINGDDRTTATSEVRIAAVPGTPQNVMAVGSMEDCMIRVTWEPPDTGGSDYTYRVYIPSRNITANTNSSTESTLRVPNCADDIRIQVYVVNQFGCTESSGTQLRLESGSSTSGLSPGAVGGITSAIIVCIIAFVVTTVIIFFFRWEVRIQKRRNEEMMEREMMEREKIALMEEYHMMKTDFMQREEMFMREMMDLERKEQEKMKKERMALMQKQEKMKRENMALMQKQDTIERKNMALMQEHHMMKTDFEQEQEKMKKERMALIQDKFVSRLGFLYDTLKQNIHIPSSMQEAVHDLLDLMSEQKMSSELITVKVNVQEALKTVLKTRVTSTRGIRFAVQRLKTMISEEVMSNFDAKLAEVISITMDKLSALKDKDNHEKPRDELIQLVDKASPDTVKNLLQTFFGALRDYDLQTEDELQTAFGELGKTFANCTLQPKRIIEILEDANRKLQISVIQDDNSDSDESKGSKQQGSSARKPKGSEKKKEVKFLDVENGSREPKGSIKKGPGLHLPGSGVSRKASMKDVVKRSRKRRASKDHGLSDDVDGQSPQIPGDGGESSISPLISDPSSKQPFSKTKGSKTEEVSIAMEDLEDASGPPSGREQRQVSKI